MAGSGRVPLEEMRWARHTTADQRLGAAVRQVRDVVNIGRGSIIELDRGPGTPLDVRVNGVLIGRGEVVLVNADKLGLRFVEVVSQAERVKRLS